MPLSVMPKLFNKYIFIKLQKYLSYFIMYRSSSRDRHFWLNLGFLILLHLFILFLCVCVAFVLGIMLFSTSYSSKATRVTIQKQLKHFEGHIPEKKKFHKGRWIIFIDFRLCVCLYSCFKCFDSRRGTTKRGDISHIIYSFVIFLFLLEKIFSAKTVDVWLPEGGCWFTRLFVHPFPAHQGTGTWISGSLRLDPVALLPWSSSSTPPAPSEFCYCAEGLDSSNSAPISMSVLGPSLPRQLLNSLFRQDNSLWA